jgi:hypothetical protein
MKSDLKIHETVLAKEGLSSTEGASLSDLLCGGNELKNSMIDRLQDFWGTYTTLQVTKRYTPETVLKDAIYGLGISISNEKYSGADGFYRFKKELAEYINT